MLGISAQVAVVTVGQVFHARVSAMVSPALAAGNEATVLGKAPPPTGAPAYTDLVKPARPCDSGNAGLAGVGGSGQASRRFSSPPPPSTPLSSFRPSLPP